MSKHQNPLRKLFFAALAALVWAVVSASTAQASVQFVSGPPKLSNETSATFEMSVPAGALIRCNLDDAENLYPCGSSITFNKVKHGEHVFYARAVVSGVPQALASYSFEVDLVAPRPSILSAEPPMGETSFDGTASFTYGADEEVSGFLCRVVRFGQQGGAWEECPLDGYTVSGLDEGLWSFEVRATDLVGNTSTSFASTSFRVDVTPPETLISDLEIYDDRATFWLGTTGLDAERGVSFECRLDDSSWEDCSSGEITYKDLGPGEHVFRARAIDVAGRRDPTPVERRWVVTAKGEALDSYIAVKRKPRKRVRTKRVAVLFDAYGLEGHRFRCRLDKRRWRNCRPGKAMRFRIGKRKRTHEIVIIARDAAGALSAREVIRFQRA